MPQAVQLHLAHSDENDEVAVSDRAPELSLIVSVQRNRNGSDDSQQSSDGVAVASIRIAPAPSLFGHLSLGVMQVSAGKLLGTTFP